MTRKELANELFKIIKQDRALKVVWTDAEIWKAIAETDDESALNELERRRELHDSIQAQTNDI